MLKIGVIGLGDIAQKAYLPVLSKKEVEVICLPVIRPNFGISQRNIGLPMYMIPLIP
jgi:hypothetical protein